MKVRGCSRGIAAFVAVLIAAIGALILFLPAAEARAAHCGAFSSGGFSPYFFDDYESVEYINNLLVFHFELKTPFNDGRSWRLNFDFVSDECGQGNLQLPETLVNISPGVQFYSIRLVSSTRFEIWNDEADIQEPCAGCAKDVPEFPGYYEIAFSGVIDSGESSFRSSFYRISSTAAAPAA